MPNNVEFKIVGDKVNVTDYHIFKANIVEKQNPNGKVSSFVELKSPNWVSAIVYDEDRKDFVVVEQYRHGINKVITEIPCGMVEEGEDSLVAAVRECREEVGLCSVTSTQKLFEHAANPAFLNNYMTSYFIIGKLDETKLDPDENEFINIKHFDFNQMQKMMGDKDTNVMLRLAWEIAKNICIKQGE